MKNRIRNRVVLSLTSIGLVMLVLVILGPTPKGATPYRTCRCRRLPSVRRLACRQAAAS